MIISFLKNLGISLILLLLSSFITTILNYFNIINAFILNIFNIIIPIISLFVGGYLIGKETNKLGYLEGIKFGSIFAVILVLFNILGLGNGINFKIITLCLILIISSMIGSMIGINKKREN